MTASYTYDGNDLTRIRRDSGELVQTAELGTVGQSQLTYDDTAGTQEIIGQKDFEANEDDCTSPLMHRGFIADRGYSRGLESVGMGREIEISIEDLNSMLGFRGITGGDRRRPVESVDDRIAWLLASDYVTGLFADNGRIDSSTNEMDKADYSNQTPSDVVADCALAARGFNFHVQDYGSGPELIFRNDNTSTADSISLRISNVLTDDPWQIGDTVSGTQVFAPSKDARLTRSPSLVWSKLSFSYAKNTRVRERPATATAFNGERFGTASNSNIKRAGTADDEADHLLWEHSTEEDVLECSILVPSSAVNLFPAGYRLQAKFSHLTTEGYGSYAWFRILEVGKRSLLKPAALYELRLKLSPQEAAQPLPACFDVATPDGNYYPLGGNTGASTANPSDGVVVYGRPGDSYPTTTAAATGYVGHWHFPIFGAGGTGTIDYAGDCTQNLLRFIVVGNGTATIQSEIWAGSTRPMHAIVYKPDGTFISSQDFTSGDSIDVVIDDTSEDDCTRMIDIGDRPDGNPCGGKFGWSQMTWVGA